MSHLKAPQYLRPLKPNAISWTFVISDGELSRAFLAAHVVSPLASMKAIVVQSLTFPVITFLIQAAGGGLSISKNITTAEAGGRIFLAGIAAQMASFLLFTSLWAMFAVRA